jgi:UDP-N-acetylmuramyl pentapeptide synthase
VSGNRKWIVVGAAGAVIAASLAVIGTPVARAALAVEVVALVTLLGTRLARIEQTLQTVRRAQKRLERTVRDQEIETGLAALNRYAALAGERTEALPGDGASD